MATDQAMKKVKRGKRGGKKLNKEPSAVSAGPAPVPIQQAAVSETGVHNEHPAALLADSAPTDGQPPKKRTRRGGQGKKIAPVEASGVNSVEVGSGRTAQEQASWDDWEAGRAPRHDGRPPQPYFPPMQPDEHHYFITMEKELDEKEFETEEDKAMFVAAMFRELDGKECAVAADPDCSRVLEKMLRASDDFRLRVFTDRLNGQFAQLFRHQFASHVCQTVLYLAADVVDREMKGESVIDVPEEEAEVIKTLPTMEQLISVMCEQLEEEWNALIPDQYASHLVRAVLKVLSGEPLAQSEGDRRSKKSQKYNSEHKNTWKETQSTRRGAVKRTVPEAFNTILAKITQSVSDSLSNADLREYAQHPVANPVLQLLISFANTSEALVNAIMGISDADSCLLERDTFIDALLVHPVGSHLMEKLMAVARPHLFHQLYVTYFRTRLLELCTHPVANFVVQQLIVNTRNATQLEVLLDELLGSFDALLWRNRAGIVVKIVETCVKHQTCQKEVVKAICTAFHASTTDQRRQIISLILLMQTFERYDPSAKPNLHGSLMLQHLLSFEEEHNKIIIDSFMALTPEESRGWASDAVASRVIEQFLLAPAVSTKAKRKVIRGWLGSFSAIASDKFGSHVVDKCWAVADIGLKEKIAEDLLSNYNALSANHFGKFVLRNCKIESFKRKREEWVEKEMGIERKRDMFKDFLGENGATDPNAALASGKGETKKGKKKAEVDPLWTTHKFDEGMAVLGFGGGKVAVAPTKDVGRDKKKAKKDKTSSKAAQEYEDVEKMALQDDDDDKAAVADGDAEASAISKASKDEIENLFQKTKKRKRDDEDKKKLGRHSRTANHDDQTDSDSSDDDATPAPVAVNSAVQTPKKDKKMQKELAGVLDAISATKRKKGKSAESKDAKKSGKQATNPKRKFEG
ncbi:armadillo-type protein [Powellomyces hirtus]|nr:armadillo-type protein [Powellomyces hirtus]